MMSALQAVPTERSQVRLVRDRHLGPDAPATYRYFHEHSVISRATETLGHRPHIDHVLSNRAGAKLPRKTRDI